MGINLSISNIAWTSENDRQVYAYIRDAGFKGLEIAPTRLFAEHPYDKKSEARQYADSLKKAFDLSICSIQSIWYGRNERLFGTSEERTALLDYTKRAIDFAETIGAGNLVFGCPKNRIVNDSYDIEKSIYFFRELGDYAAHHGTVLAIEPNPVVYGTNFINTTKDAIDIVKIVASEGFKLNLDFGTIIFNSEHIEELKPCIDLINHVHISEPNLGLIKHRDEHTTLMQILKDAGYTGYVSIEMGKCDDIKDVLRTVDYLTTL